MIAATKLMYSSTAPLLLDLPLASDGVLLEDGKCKVE
jgi:hypothetical protein